MNLSVIHVVIIMGVVLTSIICEGQQTGAECSSGQTPMLSASIPSESSPVVSAVLLECPKDVKYKPKLSTGSDPGRKQPQCEEQLMVNIRVNPSFHIEKLEKFLILDEVYDPRKRTKAKIMSPYLIEISRGEPIMMYPLEFTKAVKCDNCETTNHPSLPNDTATTNKAEEKTCNPIDDKPTQESMNRVIQKITDALTPATKINSETEKVKSQPECGSEGNSTVMKDSPSKNSREENETNENEQEKHKCKDDNKRNPIKSNSQNEIIANNEKTLTQASIENVTYEEKNTPDAVTPQTYENRVVKEIPDSVAAASRDIREQQATVGIEGSLMNKLEERGGKMAQLGIVQSSDNIRALETADHSSVVKSNAVDNHRGADDLLENNSWQGTHTSESIQAPQKNSKKRLSLPGNKRRYQLNLEYDESDGESGTVESEQQNEPDLEPQSDVDVIDDDVGRENYISGKIDKRLKNSHSGKRKSKLQMREEVPIRGPINVKYHYGADENEDYNSENVDYNTDKINDNNYVEKKHGMSESLKSCPCKTFIEGKPSDDDSESRANDININNSHYDYNTESTESKYSKRISAIPLKSDQTEEEDQENQNKVNHKNIVNHNVRELKKEQQKYFPDGRRQINKLITKANRQRGINKLAGILQELAEMKLKPNRQVNRKHTLWIERDYGDEDDTQNNAVQYNNGKYIYSDKAIGLKQMKRIHSPKDNGGNQFRKAGYYEKIQSPAGESKVRNQYYSEGLQEDKMPIKQPDMNSEPLDIRNYGANRKIVYSSQQPNELNREINSQNDVDIGRDTNSYEMSRPLHRTHHWNEPNRITHEPPIASSQEMKIRYDNHLNAASADMNPRMYDNHQGTSATNELNEQKYDNHYGIVAKENFHGNSNEMNRNDFNNFNKQMYDTENSNENDEINTVADSRKSQVSDSSNQLYSSSNYMVLPPYERDSSKSSKELNWIDSQLESLDLLHTLDTVYTEKPSKDMVPFNRKYYSAMLPAPRSSARELIYREPAQFLPKMPPYARVIDDPNLNINDKLRVIEVVDPPNALSERKMNQLSQEVEKSFIIHPTPFPIPFASVFTSANTHKLVDNSNKQKRSFLFYDDLEMRESFDNDNDNGDDNIDQKRSQSSSSIHVEEDAQPCSSCGGKGKKPPGKNDPTVHTSENSCICEAKSNDVCLCDSESAAVVNAPTDSVAASASKSSPTDSSSFTPVADYYSVSAPAAGDRSGQVGVDSQKEPRSVLETWYSVFNMSAPLPFLTTKMRIFRKRRNTWWKIAPSITLNSLSGIFANANLSILFSSHVDIFQLEKSLRLQNHQLIIPKDNQPLPQSGINLKLSTKTSRMANFSSIEEHFCHIKSLNTNPNMMFAIEGAKFPRAVYDVADHDTFLGKSVMEKKLCSQIKEVAKRNLINKSKTLDDEKVTAWSEYDLITNKRHTKKTPSDGIRTIGDLGYFPTSMNLLEQCPNDKLHLCLNMLDDKVPAYSFKLKMPFRENTVVSHNSFKVKIAMIITDATTKDALQVSVDVVNKNIDAHEFSISVANCPTGCATAAKTTVMKLLVPNIGETVTFLLPLIMESNQRHTKFVCDVIVTANIVSETSSPPISHNGTTLLKRTSSGSRKIVKSKTVALRQMMVEAESRCFCVWECSCHCVTKLETHVDFNVCQKLSYIDEKKAGLLLHCLPGEEGESLGTEDEADIVETEESSGFYDFLHNALILLLIVLLLGFIKALIGRFIKTVDCWGYGYVQPGRSYDNSSRLRRFFVNTFFFIVFPFVFWCKCFTPSEEDLLVASTEWQCSTDQDPSERSKKDLCDDDEDVILTQEIDRRSTCSCLKSSGSRLEGGQDVCDMDKRITDFTLAFNEHIFDDEEDEDEEVNTKFILQALVESRESLKKLLRDHSSHQVNVIPVDEEEEPKLQTATELVYTLKTAQIVYRVFEGPVGNVRNIPVGTRYSIQGYFLPSLGEEYEFVNYNPLAQYRCRDPSSKSMTVLRPPLLLCPKDFSRVYANKLEVLKAADLFVNPPPDAPCINICTMAVVATSVANLAAEEKFFRLEESLENSPPVHHWHEFDLPLDEEEQPEEVSHEQSTSDTVDYCCLIDIEDQLKEESEEVLTGNTSFDINTYTCDTIPE